MINLNLFALKINISKCSILPTYIYFPPIAQVYLYFLEYLDQVGSYMNKSGNPKPGQRTTTTCPSVELQQNIARQCHRTLGFNQRRAENATNINKWWWIFPEGHVQEFSNLTASYLFLFSQKTFWSPATMKLKLEHSTCTFSLSLWTAYWKSPVFMPGFVNGRQLWQSGSWMRGSNAISGNWNNNIAI